MLTVKLVEPKGYESIHEVKKVWSNQSEIDSTAQTVFVETDTGEVMEFGPYGTVYVMNDGGQTIAKYWLGGGYKAEAA